MNPETWKQIKSVFDEAVEMSPEQRFRLFDAVDGEIRSEVEKMLAADSGGLIEHSPIFHLAENGFSAPERINQYKIEAEIGRGGMGTVYLAERDDGEFEQKVAIKIIKRGMDSDEILRRFRHERQILASLQHPNIAQLLDGGISSDGSPFYAMEFVEGSLIDEFCDKNGLSTDERLTLFRQVCAAVSYAHSRLVVHRDLKPSNILVTADGTVKLLDFGIAKVLSPDEAANKRTATALGMMTPAYASPEQKRGETVSTATDVFSLGIILSELLHDQQPETKGGETDRVAKTTSTGKQMIRGELRNILDKATHLEPARRYASVEAFSEDVRRHLSGMPIIAKPDTFRYRASKFIQRNRLAVFSSILVMLALVAGTTVALWQARQAELERQLAQRRFEISRQVANSLVFRYHDAIANLPDSLAVREMLLSDATRYLDELSQDAQGDADLQTELARAYMKLADIQGSVNSISTGNSIAAAQNLEKAVTLFEVVYGNSKSAEIEALSDDLITVYAQLTDLYWRTNELGKRQIYLDKRRSLVEDLVRRHPDHPKYKMEFLRLQNGIGGRLLTSDFTAGEAFYQQNILPQLADAERAMSEFSLVESTGIRVYSTLGLAYNNHGLLQAELGASHVETENYFRRSLEYYSRAGKIYERQLGKDPANRSAIRNYAVGLTTIGIALRELGRFEESFDFLDRGHRRWQELARLDAKNMQAVFDLGDSHSAIGLLYLRKKDHRRAIQEFGRSIDFFNRAIAIDQRHHEALSYKIDVIGFLAESQSEAGRTGKALELLASAKTLSQDLTSEANDRVQIGRICLQTARIYGRIGDIEKARNELNQAAGNIERSGASNAGSQLRIVRLELSRLSGN